MAKKGGKKAKGTKMSLGQMQSWADEVVDDAPAPRGALFFPQYFCSPLFSPAKAMLVSPSSPLPRAARRMRARRTAAAATTLAATTRPATTTSAATTAARAMTTSAVSTRPATTTSAATISRRARPARAARRPTFPVRHPLFSFYRFADIFLFTSLWTSLL